MKLQKRIDRSSRERQKLVLAALLLLIVLLTMTRVLSYFHSEDTATNRMEGKNGSVAIHEPAWDAEGQKMARASEPGMEIPKNPYGLNDSEINLYIRLRMTVENGAFVSKNSDYDAQFHYDDAEREAAVLKAVKLADGTALLNADRTETNNTAFYMETVTENGRTVYDFYYTAGGENLASVAPDGTTAELFHSLLIPYYKSEYFGVFDQPYTIQVVAEGIPVSQFPDGVKAADAAAAFA